MFLVFAASTVSAVSALPVVGIVLGDVGVNPREGELLVPCLGDCLHNQLGVREGRLRVVLRKGQLELWLVVDNCLWGGSSWLSPAHRPGGRVEGIGRRVGRW